LNSAINQASSSHQRAASLPGRLYGLELSYSHEQQFQLGKDKENSRLKSLKTLKAFPAFQRLQRSSLRTEHQGKRQLPGHVHTLPFVCVLPDGQPASPGRLNNSQVCCTLTLA
uniref:Uncharacterized protein n=1 Tax=Stegastes partitus TaxID=144197 RepID=A0A3B5B3P3_9TELE